MRSEAQGRFSCPVYIIRIECPPLEVQRHRGDVCAAGSRALQLRFPFPLAQVAPLALLATLRRSHSSEDNEVKIGFGEYCIMHLLARVAASTIGDAPADLSGLRQRLFTSAACETPRKYIHTHKTGDS